MEIITRAEARKRELTRYFTGRPCIRGHVVERFTGSGQCRECSRILQKADHKSDPAKKINGSAEYRRKNREKILLSRSVYRRENREKIALQKRIDYLKRKPQILAKKNERSAKRRASDAVFCLSHRVRALLGNALRRNGYKKASKTSLVLGCSWPEFAAHIERQFLPGMTWTNRSLWHVDHIVALATATTEADVLALNHFTNLRPLWSVDNIKKSTKRTHLL